MGNGKGKAVTIDAKCDFCSNKAVADGKTKFGSWDICVIHILDFMDIQGQNFSRHI